MKKLRKSENCLNCGNDVKGCNYCSFCGQINTNKHVKIKYFLEDFLGDYLTFDSKFFKSFVPLVSKPGFLTNEYNRGKRVNYILPLRLYLFVVFIFFMTSSVQVNLSDSTSSPDGLRGKGMKNLLKDFSGKDYIDESSLEKLSGKYKVIERISKEKINLSKSLGDAPLARFFEKKIMKLAEKAQLEGEGDFISEIFNQIPKVLFILLPFFALILKLVYLRRKILYIKHLVFALHLHTVLFLFFLPPVIFRNRYVFLICLLGVIFYIYKAFRKVYNQPVMKTAVKIFLVSCGYMFLFPLTMVMVILLSLANV